MSAWHLGHYSHRHEDGLNRNVSVTLPPYSLFGRLHSAMAHKAIYCTVRKVVKKKRKEGRKAKAVGTWHSGSQFSHHLEYFKQQCLVWTGPLCSHPTSCWRGDSSSTLVPTTGMRNPEPALTFSGMRGVNQQMSNISPSPSPSLFLWLSNKIKANTIF